MANLRAPTSQHPISRTMLPMDNDAMEIELARSRSQSISGTSSPSNSDSDDPRSGSPSSVRSLSSTSTVSSDREEAFFRDMAGRKLNTMNVAYTLPSDSSEIKVSVGIVVVAGGAGGGFTFNWPASLPVLPNHQFRGLTFPFWNAPSDWTKNTECSSSCSTRTTSATSKTCWRLQKKRTSVLWIAALAPACG